MNINVTIRFGAGEVTLPFSAGSTAGSVLADGRVKAALGFGDNTQAVQDGVVLRPGTPLEANDVITVETKANQKAS